MTDSEVVLQIKGGNNNEHKNIHIHIMVTIGGSSINDDEMSKLWVGQVVSWIFFFAGKVLLMEFGLYRCQV